MEMSSTEYVKVMHNDKQIEGCIHRPVENSNGYCIILTHGAGGDMNHRSLQSAAEAVCKEGLTCVRFTCKSLNLVYRTRVFKSVLDHIHNTEKLKGYFLGGRSMGSRAAVGLANEDPPCEILGVICLSYPLHTEDNRDKLRDEPLKALALPSIFISGTEDKMCDKDKLEKIMEKNAKARIKWIVGADHSCKVKGRTEADVSEEVNESLVTWCKERIKTRTGTVCSVNGGETEEEKPTTKGKRRQNKNKETYKACEKKMRKK